MFACLFLMESCPAVSTYMNIVIIENLYGRGNVVTIPHMISAQFARIQVLPLLPSAVRRHLKTCVGIQRTDRCYYSEMFNRWLW